MKSFLMVLAALLASHTSFATPSEFRVAIVENLKFEKLSTDKYANDYLDGITAATQEAKARGYNVTVKNFFYDKEPLAVLKVLPDVDAWNPDLVIGPRSSTFFLMLKDHFKDVLVLSPFATATAVSEMPSNFYSMTLSNSYFTRAVVNLAAERFPNRAVAPIVEVDCKNCMDFADEFTRFAKEDGIAVRTKATYLNKNAETTDVSALTGEVRETDILLVPNTSYSSGAIIPRLADHLQRKDLVVIGGDGWGDWSASYVGKVKSKFPYAGYRLTPWSFDVKDKRHDRFFKAFRDAKATAPTGTASLLSYHTLSVALDLLPAKAAKGGPALRGTVLRNFQDKVKQDPNFERPTKYALYKVTQEGESFVGEVSALKEVKK